MTRERIAEGLEILCLQLANGDTTLPEGWQPHEWAYVKGSVEEVRAVLTLAAKHEWQFYANGSFCRKCGAGIGDAGECRG